MTTSLDKFELWAMWCHDGGVKKQSSMISKMMDSGGYLTFGNGGFSDDLDCLEARLESAMLKLATESKDAAEVVRVHYGARNYRHLKLGVKAKASIAGVSVTKYYRLLKKAKDYIETNL